ncbi:MAG TPA: hypothetical protein QF626_02515 [Prochlorococcaceae cyanobacterium Fu_MAG_50]|nr:hypothetical protein [Prochlorococcaceae cyanobacterium Fu_MAG_50]
MLSFDQISSLVMFEVLAVSARRFGQNGWEIPDVGIVTQVVSAFLNEFEELAVTAE